MLESLIKEYKEARNSVINLEELESKIIKELRDNPKGIIITTTQSIGFNTDMIDDDDFEWLFDKIYKNNSSTIESILADDYYEDNAWYYEEKGCELDYNIEITDLEGNDL